MLAQYVMLTKIWYLILPHNLNYVVNFFVNHSAQNMRTVTDFGDVLEKSCYCNGKI